MMADHWQLRGDVPFMIAVCCELVRLVLWWEGADASVRGEVQGAQELKSFWCGVGKVRYVAVGEGSERRARRKAKFN